MTPAEMTPETVPREHVERINKLFVWLGGLYGGRFTSQYDNRDGRLSWLMALADVTDEELREGCAHCRTNGGGWPPNAMEFRRFCRANLYEQTRRRFVRWLRTQERITDPVVLAIKEAIGHYECLSQPLAKIEREFREQFDALNMQELPTIPPPPEQLAYEEPRRTDTGLAAMADIGKSLGARL